MNNSQILYRFLVFCLAGCLVYLAFGFGLLFFGREKITVELSKDVKAIIIGHSHVECGVDETYFPGIKNYGKSGEALYYGCLKAKKIVQENTQIKTVFVECSANQFDAHMKDWICDEEHFQRAMKSYYFLLDWRMKRDFFSSFPSFYLQSQLLAEKKILALLLGSKEKCNVGEMEWGGFVKKDTTIMDSIQGSVSVSPKNLVPYPPNVNAIKDLIDFCESRKVQVVFVRLPVHHSETEAFENSFQSILNDHFAGVRFYDYRSMSLPDSCFLDREHLNYDGAKIFSRRFFEDCFSQCSEGL